MSKLVERLIIEIKEKYHLKYDEDVADYVNITASHLNRMKKREGQPNAANFVKLAITAGWSMEKANVILNDGIEQKDLQVFERGYANVSLLAVTGLAAIALPYCYNVLKHCILCSINGVKLKTERKLIFRFY